MTMPLRRFFWRPLDTTEGMPRLRGQRRAGTCKRRTLAFALAAERGVGNFPGTEDFDRWLLLLHRGKRMFPVFGYPCLAR
jgi:hypothetical protein